MLSKQDRWNRVEKRPVHFEGIFFITRRTAMLDIKQIRNQFDEVEAKLKHVVWHLKNSMNYVISMLKDVS